MKNGVNRIVIATYILTENYLNVITKNSIACACSYNTKHFNNTSGFLKSPSISRGNYKLHDQ
jgi:hypothetical protein